MNHRDRVKCALNFKEGDRPPIDLFGTASRITNPLYEKLKESMGLKGDGFKDRPGKTAEYTDYRIADYFDIDFRHVILRPNNSRPKNKKPDEDPSIFYDDWGCGYKQYGYYPHLVFSPLANAEDVDIDQYEWPDVKKPERLNGLAEEARYYHEETDFYVTALSPISGLALDFCFYLRGQEQFLCDLYLDAKFAHHLLDKVSDIITEMYIFYIEPIKEYIGYVEFESDYGMQNNLLIPVEKYREFIKKPNEKVFNAVRHIAPNVKIYLHSCGAVRDLIPEFIESGVNILQSLQPRASGMDSERLKKDFYGEIVLCGGLDLQGNVQGTIEEAIAEARYRLDSFSPGGGYIFGPSNHWQPDTPPENFIAIYETAKNYRYR